MTAGAVQGWPAEYVERYRRAGYWRGETFGRMLRERAEDHGGRTAVVDPASGARWSYAELDARADAMAAGLSARGVCAGDRVVLQLPNVAEFFEVVFALFRLGALPVFALPAHRYAEIRYLCDFTEAVAYVVPGVHGGFDYRELAGRVRAEVPTLRHVFVADPDPGGHEPLAGVPAAPVPLAEPAPHDLAFLQLSGGTTGVPKLIPRTHDDYIYSVWGSNEICGVDEHSVYLCALPAAHNFPLSSPGTLGALYAGGRVVLAPQPAPETAFPLIEREGVTITGLVPPLALVWLEAAQRGEHDLSSLEVLLVGGAKFSEEAARRVRPTLGCTLQQVFGMAEGLVNYTRLDDPEETVVTTQGRPVSPDDEIRVVDEDDHDVPEGATGHLLTRGPYTIRGYWRAPEHNAVAFTEDGFYRTGDVVRRTPTGHLVVEGRAKDQINRGGEKIAAEEVENHLLAHPSVHDAAVVSMPDGYLGERVCAYIVLRRNAAPVKPLQVKKFLRERGLAAYKIPDRIEFSEAFPATGIGKVSKRDLRAAVAAQLQGATT
ncbi:(2,3-dihydroxybenzoyl)adenylate synthase [Streptomyces nanshensis]|uniref:Enterobactin synthase subunit E n=1 Tax=Streptomyces nanshensis TaxID=518642 RepID=A0A1E7LDE9_9ACTN|nr:(2,3-dihydroxybenzoyl)adenylate synthase [Streptomyces nanshensis]OEV14198.1 enterobactin synthase subunit E [Streptomyces nanshensis]